MCCASLLQKRKALAPFRQFPTAYQTLASGFRYCKSHGRVSKIVPSDAAVSDVDVQRRSWELGCSQIGKKTSSHQYLEQSQQEANYADHSSIGPQQNWVNLQDLHMGESNSPTMNVYPHPQEHAMQSYSVARSPQEPLYVNVGEDANHIMPLDPALTHQQPETNQQHRQQRQHPIPQAHGRPVAFSNSRTKPFAANLKSNHPSLIVYPGQTLDGSNRKTASSAEGLKASDHSSSKPSEITPETLALMVSDIADRLNMTGHQYKRDLESVIKSSVQSLLNSNKARKRSYTDSPGSNETPSEHGGFKCGFCPKSRKTQCELK